MLNFYYQVNLPHAKALLWAAICLVVVREFRVIKIAFHIDADADLLRSNLGFLFRTSCVVLSWVIIWALTDINNAEKYSELLSRAHREFITLKNGYEGCDENCADDFYSSNEYETTDSPTQFQYGHCCSQCRGEKCDNRPFHSGNRSQPHYRRNRRRRTCISRSFDGNLAVINDDQSTRHHSNPNNPSETTIGQNTISIGNTGSSSTGSTGSNLFFNGTSSKSSAQCSVPDSPLKELSLLLDSIEEFDQSHCHSERKGTYNYEIVCNVIRVESNTNGKKQDHVAINEGLTLSVSGEPVQLEHARKRILDLGCDPSGSLLKLSASTSPSLSSCSTTASDLALDLTSHIRFDTYNKTPTWTALGGKYSSESQQDQQEPRTCSAKTDELRAAAALKEYVEKHHKSSRHSAGRTNAFWRKRDNTSTYSAPGGSVYRYPCKRRTQAQSSPNIRPSLDNFVTYKTSILSPWSLFTVAEISFVTIIVYSLATYEIYGWASVPIAVVTYCGFINLTELMKLVLGPKNRHLRWLAAFMIVFVADVSKLGKRIPLDASVEFFASKGNIVSQILILFCFGFTTFFLAILGIGISLQLFGRVSLFKWSPFR